MKLYRRFGFRMIGLVAALLAALIGGAGAQDGAADSTRYMFEITAADRRIAATPPLPIPTRNADLYNGKIVLVYPAEGIVVDGDLTDWPDDLEKHPIPLHISGVPPRDERDFQAHFQIAYNTAENALYVAVEARDDSLVAESNDNSWWNDYDGCEIYVYLGHILDDMEMAQYVLWGFDRRVYGAAQLEHVEVEMHRADGVYRYEWKVDIAALSGGRVQLGPEMDLGFDVVVGDKDGEIFSYMAWGEGAVKIDSPSRVGQAILLAPGNTLEQLVGTFFTTRSESEYAIKKIRISTSYQMFFTGILLAFTVVHFLLFIFYPQMRANLYYALFTSTIAACIFFGFQWEMGAEDDLLFAMVLTLALFLEGVVGLLFLYSLFYQTLPGRFWMFLAVLVSDAIFTGLVARGQIDLGDVTSIGFMMIWPLSIMVMLAVFGETIRLVFESIRQKKEGAWIVGLGFGAFIIANTRLVFMLVLVQYGGSGTLIGEISAILPVGGIDVTVILGLLFPLVAMSINLARSFARTSKDLEVRLVQVQELSAKMQEQNQELGEANVQIQEANRLKSDFLARMSHDLRTPMNAIIGYTRILLRRSKETLEPRMYRNLENVQISANNLLTLINDILDLSKIESGRIDIRAETVDLQELIGECAASVESLVKPGVELRREIGEVGPVLTDQDRIRRVVINLLSNAVKFTEAGHIALALREVDGWTEIAVIDTGIGIPPEDLPHIFDEFRQVDGVDGSQQEGTGLGLAIVQKSLELLGGSIEVESEVGKGSIFAIRLRDYEASGGGG